MAHLAIAYPTIDSSDYDWIQGIRKTYDRQFDIVQPHITLIFGTEKLSLAEFAEHIRDSLAGTKSFPINLASARVVEDNSKRFFHAFLIPSDGFDEINNLHDVLYKGPLASELRPDIPFIPTLPLAVAGKRKC